MQIFFKSKHETYCRFCLKLNSKIFYSFLSFLQNEKIKLLCDTLTEFRACVCNQPGTCAFFHKLVWNCFCRMQLTSCAKGFTSIQFDSSKTPSVTICRNKPRESFSSTVSPGVNIWLVNTQVLLQTEQVSPAPISVVLLTVHLKTAGEIPTSVITYFTGT